MDGYKTNTDATQCEKVEAQKTVSAEVQTSTATTQAVMGAGAAVGGAASMLSMSSPQAVWMMVNQFQLLMLLPLTEAFLPEDIIDYFTGMSFTNFNFNFLKLEKLPTFGSLYELFGFDEEDEYLKDLGIQYKSTLLNNISLLLIIFGLVSLHLIILAVYR